MTITKSLLVMNFNSYFFIIDSLAWENIQKRCMVTISFCHLEVVSAVDWLSTDFPRRSTICFLLPHHFTYFFLLLRWKYSFHYVLDPWFCQRVLWIQLGLSVSLTVCLSALVSQTLFLRTGLLLFLDFLLDLQVQETCKNDRKKKRINASFSGL